MADHTGESQSGRAGTKRRSEHGHDEQAKRRHSEAAKARALEKKEENRKEHFIKLADMALALLASAIFLTLVRDEMAKEESLALRVETAIERKDKEAQTFDRLKKKLESEWEGRKDVLVDELLLEGFRTTSKSKLKWKEESGLQPSFIQRKTLSELGTDRFVEHACLLNNALKIFVQKCRSGSGDDPSGSQVLSLSSHHQASDSTSKATIKVVQKGLDSLASFERSLHLYTLSQAVALTECNARLAMSTKPADRVIYNNMYEKTTPMRGWDNPGIATLQNIITEYGRLSQGDLDCMHKIGCLYDQKQPACRLLELALTKVSELPELDFSNVA